MASGTLDARASGNLDVRLRRLEEVLGVQVQSRAMAPRVRELEELSFGQQVSGALIARVEQLEVATFGAAAVSEPVPVAAPPSATRELPREERGGATPTTLAPREDLQVMATTQQLSQGERRVEEAQPPSVEAAPTTLALCAELEGLPKQHGRVQALAGKSHAGSKGIEHFKEFDFGTVCNVDSAFMFVSWDRTSKITQIPMDRWRSWCKVVEACCDNPRPSVVQSEPEGEPSTDTVLFPLGIDAFKVGDECQGKDVNGTWWPVRVAAENDDDTIDVLVHDGYESVWPSLHRANLKPHDDESFRELEDAATCSGLLDDLDKAPALCAGGDGASASPIALELAGQAVAPEVPRRGGRGSQRGRGGRGRGRGSGNNEGNGRRSSTQKSTKLPAAEPPQDPVSAEAANAKGEPGAVPLLAVKCEPSVQPSSGSAAVVSPDAAAAATAPSESGTTVIAPSEARAKREFPVPAAVKAESDDESASEPGGSGTSWRYTPCNNRAMSIRVGPSVGSEKHSQTIRKPLYPGDKFRVVEELGPDEQGVTFLKLLDGRGWVFDVNPGVGVMCTRRKPGPDCGRTGGRSRRIKTAALPLKNVPAGEASRWSTLVPVKLEKSKSRQLRLRGVRLPPTTATAAAKRLLALNTNKSGGCGIFHHWRMKLGEMLEALAEGHVRQRSLALLETMDAHFTGKTGGTWRPFVICVLRLLGTSSDEVSATLRRHNVIEEAISLAEELTDARLAGVPPSGAIAEGLQGRSLTSFFVPRGRGSGSGRSPEDNRRTRPASSGLDEAEESPRRPGRPRGRGRGGGKTKDPLTAVRPDKRRLVSIRSAAGSADEVEASSRGRASDGVPLGVKCPSGHFMKDLGIQDDDWECDSCHRMPQADRSFSCVLCGYDLCPACYSAQPKERHGYTLAEVGRHASRSSCWVVLSGRVLDVTHWLSGHPGGDLALLAFAGRDATEEFKMLHSMSVLDTHSPELHPDLGPLLPDAKALDSGPAAPERAPEVDMMALFAD